MEDSAIQKILPTYIYNKVLDKKNIIEHEVLRFINFQQNKFFKAFPEDDFTYLYAPYERWEKSIIEDHNMINLKKEILRCVEEYKNKTPFEGKPKIIDSWMVKYEKNHLSKTHHHPRKGISGCYYYKTTNSPGNGDFYFQDNWKNNHAIVPEKGQLILFPSWLNHGVTINKTDKTRMCLAFNIIFE